MPTRRQLLLQAGSVLLLGSSVHGALAAAAPKVYRIAARRFVYTPEVLEIPANQVAMVELTVSDVVMGFSLPDLHLRVDLVPGQTARLTLPPLPPGEMPFLCDVFCGSGHEQMSGLLRVVS